MRSPFNPASLVLVMLLACSALQPELTTLAPGFTRAEVPPAPAVHGPGAVEWVEARFLSHQTALNRSEIRAVAESVMSSDRSGVAMIARRHVTVRDAVSG